MVIPNLGAFMAWGILTAVGIAIDNEVLRRITGRRVILEEAVLKAD